MPTVTVTDEIEIIGPGRGRGGRGRPPGGDGGGGNEGAGGSAVPQRTYVTGMTVALGGILMFFMALVSAYIVRKGTSNDWRALEVPRILWVNTAVLILSSLTLSRSRKKLLRGDQSAFRHWWLVTSALGFLFLVGQIIAWKQLANAGVFLATNPSSSFFYVFTAAHGLHLLGGVIALFWVALLPMRRLTQSTATTVASMYWHFMDGLWVFIFLLLLLGR
ncbi:MAG: heme-copper oxidase subunit III [Candidatus Acidiferrales bacterium]|jgi:cytochrome c oxidase subunit 3